MRCDSSPNLISDDDDAARCLISDYLNNPTYYIALAGYDSAFFLIRMKFKVKKKIVFQRGSD